MNIDFYGVRAPIPSTATVEVFGGHGKPKLLAGGQGTTYRAGDIVLKPAEGTGGGDWIAKLFAGLPESDEVRFARPIMSKEGHWFHDGYVAWSYLTGVHVKGRYAEKLKSSLAYHALLANVPKPPSLGAATHSWSAANLVVWDHRPFDYGPEFKVLIDRIAPHLKQLDLPRQLIHGDLSGNFLVAEGRPPAIIDFSPVWAPAGFAEGILLVDAIAWENAKPEDLEAFKTVPHIKQLAWRAVYRRIAEQGEHMHWFKKSKDQALKEARAFEKVMTYIDTELET